MAMMGLWLREGQVLQQGWLGKGEQSEGYHRRKAGQMGRQGGGESGGGKPGCWGKTGISAKQEE